MRARTYAGPRLIHSGQNRAHRFWPRLPSARASRTLPALRLPSPHAVAMPHLLVRHRSAKPRPVRVVPGRSPQALVGQSLFCLRSARDARIEARARTPSLKANAAEESTSAALHEIH